MCTLELGQGQEPFIIDLGDYFSLVKALLRAEVESMGIDLHELEGGS